MSLPFPEEILNRLLAAAPRRTEDAPKGARGLYGLIDHHGDLRYIGSVTSRDQSLHERIHHRHRTGSDDASHYFSRMYNTGRMWRTRNDPATKADGDVAKRLRNAFIAEHCRAVWMPLSDEAPITQLEAEVIRLAPEDSVRWNRRGMEAYAEPVELVDALIEQMGFTAADRAALGRQHARFLARGAPAPKAAAPRRAPPPFPEGPFDFVALDVETANHDRGSICQIGVACVRPDGEIETWVTHVDPRTSRWAFTWLHGIGPQTVTGAPTFAEALAVLEPALAGLTVYQHSGFDRSAFRAACAAMGRPEPDWTWRDSVGVARRAWPELKGNGGHGLASLKTHLGLVFDHHDAGEDARAAAEVVLHAEGRRTARTPCNLEVIDDEVIEVVCSDPVAPATARRFVPLTGGNIRNHHFHLREVLDLFPPDCIGGSNAASAAPRLITIDWGGDTPAITDIAGDKKLFRRRAWVRSFFERSNAREGDRVRIEMTGAYTCKVRLAPR